MIEKDKYLAASPVKVDQKELISLSGIANDTTRSIFNKITSSGVICFQYKGRGMEFDESSHTILGMIPEILIGVSQPEAVSLYKVIS